MEDVLLDIRGVSKRFAAVAALDDVSLTVRRGEVVALLGHNGSGKSTLVKVLSGIHAADGGEVVRGARGATRLHFIHQSLGLVPTLTVAENLDLTRRPSWSALLMPIRRDRERARIEEAMGAFGVTIDPDTQVSALSLARRTIVAVARALDGWSGGDHVLVLDEPTAALHGEEVESLKDAIRTAAAGGAGVVYISHRLEEVVELADRAVVLRNGRVVAALARGSFEKAELVSLIAGGVPEQGTAPRGAAGRGRAALSVRRLAGTTVKGVDLDVAAGEIVGLAGLVGSGMEEVNGLIFGAVARRSGVVAAGDAAVPPGSPAAAIAAGLAFIPADRHKLGGFGAFSARENVTLPALGGLITPWGSIDRTREDAEVIAWMDRLRVHPAGVPEHPFALFSGGNQQKLVLAKWLRTAPRVLLVDEPTQGVDAGAKAEIHRLIDEAAARGAAVLISSSDSEELAARCSRVLVFRDGLAAEELSGAELSEAGLIGAALHDAHADAPLRGEGRMAS